MMRIISISGLLLAGIIAFSGAASANLVKNGSFENGQFSGWSWTRLDKGSSLLEDWTIGGIGSDGVDWHNQTEFFPAADGDKMIDLNCNPGSEPGWISQDIATTAGCNYLLTFSLAGPNMGFQDPRRLTVNINDTQYLFNQPASNNLGLVWGVKNLTFTASGNLTTLKFIGNYDYNYWGPVIDNVSVVETGASVPELSSCSSILAMMSAFPIMGFVARRRRF